MPPTRPTRIRRIGAALLDLATPWRLLGRRGFWGRIALSFGLLALPLLAYAAWRLWGYGGASGAEGFGLFFGFEARLIAQYAWRGFANAWAFLAIPILLPAAIRRLRDAGLPGGLACLPFGAMLVAWAGVPRGEILIALQVPTFTLALMIPVLGLLPSARLPGATGA